MADPRAAKLADVLVNYSVAVQPGDWVLITGHIGAMAVAEEVVRAVAEAGGNPTVNLRADGLDAAGCAAPARSSWAGHRRWMSSWPRNWMYGSLLIAPENTRSLSGVDPARQQIFERTPAQVSGDLHEAHGGRYTPLGRGQCSLLGAGSGGRHEPA